ncbi:hypothetical protein FAM18172_01165 [Lacticaseibacillus paracasei]|uniref:Uncharacterized protein n=1 Tax=Lacticaseibacillus paracasei TaxID=1597 RepID=A0A422MC41_LACPA|nr:hypothetical protein FAM18172_01165 [Lacticaseibacillus paracasei]
MIITLVQFTHWPPARRQSGVFFCVLSIFAFAILIKEAASIVAKFITYIS